MSRIVDSTVFTLMHDFLVLDTGAMVVLIFLVVACFVVIVASSSSSLLVLAVFVRLWFTIFISMLFAVYSI